MASSSKPDSREQELSVQDDPRAAERSELATVLDSDSFRRSPKISRLLIYLCQKYFDGEQQSISEYSIATEALGRDSSFDPQLDAIVRVDTHHLRRRLSQFYQEEGRLHDLELIIPAGQYIPRFVYRNGATAGAPPRLPLHTQASVPAFRKWRWIFLPAVLLVAASLLTIKRPVTRGVIPPIPLQGEEIRILAGDREEYVDKAGRHWQPDRYYNGGTAFHRASRVIQRTQDPDIFQSGREGQFAYDIPLKQGIYELRLYFAETMVSGENLRGVTVLINGIATPTLDVVSDAGEPDTATEKIFENVSPAKDSILHLSFHGNPAFLNALEIVPGMGNGKMHPIRLRAGSTVYRDHLGHTWMPDQWFIGGRTSSRSMPIQDTGDPMLFLGERYGHFSYSIPVAESGRYTLALYFAETWFGGSAGGTGSRVFDVYCNGTTLLKHFDILKENYGSASHPVVKTFHNLEASPQGKLDLSFVPVVNYALLCAIEVVQE